LRYHAANRFQTRLAAPVDESQIYFDVESASGCPEVPFKLTVGTEIVDVIGVVGTVFRVQRGAEGTTPQSHPQGSLVQNRWTAGTYEDLWDNVDNLRDNVEAHVADFEAHKAESASKHVTESGSNDNGHYIKFDDGTMICYRQGTLTIPTMAQLPNGLWRVPNAGDFYFPETFSAAPFAEMKLHAGEEINCSPRILTSSYYNASITSVSDLSGLTKSYFLFAIGRWK